MRRTGDEPLHARSPLRMRFWLAVWGTLLMTVITVGFAATDRPGWAAVTAALAAVTVIDLFVIRRHRRQGPHYQPGPDVPPYRPADDDEPGLSRSRPAGGDRRHGPGRPPP